MGGEHTSPEPLRVGHVLVSVEQICPGLGHPQPEEVIDDVTGHDDDRDRRAAGMTTDRPDNTNAREAVETGSTVPRVDERDIDLVPQAGPAHRLGMSDRGQHFDPVGLGQGVGPPGPDPYVVIDDGNMRGHRSTMDWRTTVGQGVDWRPWDAMVASRAVLTAVQGLGSRFHQVVSPRGAAQRRSWRLAALAGAIVDIGKAAWLARDQRFRLAPRLALDAADLAVWCLAAGDDADTSEDAVIPGVPLAAEAGARWGPAGLVVPAVNAAVAAAVRSRRGHRLRLEQFSWQLMGTFGGWGVQLFARRRKALVDQQHGAELSARLRQSEMAGLHDAIVEHEGAIDLLQRATTLIDLSLPQARSRNFAGAVKAAAADVARGQATYLGDALSVWQARQNLRPDLAGIVSIELVPPQAGTLLLSESQASTLLARIGDISPVGTVHVELADGDRAVAQPFGAHRFLVNGQAIDVPPETAATRWVFDATPMAFLMNLGWLAQPTGSHREAVPWSATLPPMAATLAAGLWSARRIEQNRSISPERTVALSAAITLGYTIAANATMHHSHTESGVPRYPWVMALQGYELLRGVSAEELTPVARWTGLLGTALILTTGWWFSPQPRSARALAAELGWVIGFDVYTARLRQATVEAGQRLSTAVAAQDDDLVADAYRRGRDRAQAIIQAALASARDDLGAATQLDEDVRAEARRRLDQVAAALAAR